MGLRVVTKIVHHDIKAKILCRAIKEFFCKVSKLEVVKALKHAGLSFKTEFDNFFVTKTVFALNNENDYFLHWQQKPYLSMSSNLLFHHKAVCQAIYATENSLIGVDTENNKFPVEQVWLSLAPLLTLINLLSWT